VSELPALGALRAILLDIEGTTTPIAFVYDVLFPFARRNLRRHLERHAARADYEALLDQLRVEYLSVQGAGDDTVPPWIDAPATARLTSGVSYCEWLMDRDRKSTGLKELQGRIWQEGYASGELVGDVFADVPEALGRWRARQLRIGIFSSGSVLAQQLLFRHSSAGDLTGFIQWHFDTTTGAKIDSESYRHIATAMQLPPAAILFASDVIGELDAAREAGMQTVLSIRPGNKPAPNGHGHPVIESFDLLR
jgi:enolase-phosphatase E1